MSKKKKIHNKKKLKKRKIIQISLVVLIILFFAGIVSYYVFSKEKDPFLTFDHNSKKYESKIKKPEEWSDEKIAFPAFQQVDILKGSSKAYIALANPSFNKANIQFTVFIDDQEAPLLKSGLVRPGEAITEIKLPKDLKEGQHIITLIMKGYASADDKTELSGTETSFILNVLKK